jgi:3-oxoacyl-[acyl-carrier protein] reductase
MARFEDRVAIVTGAAEGLGFGIAERLGREGAHVTIVDVNSDLAPQASDALARQGMPSELVIGDVADEETAREAVRKTVGRWGRIDILVNNAGVGSPVATTWEMPVEEMDRIYRINLRGVFSFCRHVIPHMLERDYGRIVNVASVAGKEGNPQRVPYSASKAAVIGLTKSVGKELALTGIRVNCITPAVVMTRPNRELEQRELDYMVEKIPMGRTGTVEEMAAMIAWLASKECSFTTGTVFDVSGGRATY